MDAGTSRHTLETPSDAMERQVAIFVFLRSLRADRADLEKLASELSRLADALHHKADAVAELRRVGGREGDPRTRRLMGVIIDCLWTEAGTDLFEGFQRKDLSANVARLRAELLRRHPPQNDAPSEMRVRATALVEVAGQIHDALASHALIGASLREGQQIGHEPDVAMHVLMAWVVARQARLADVARCLAQRGLSPGDRGTEPDLALRWQDVLRHAKQRFLQRWPVDHDAKAPSPPLCIPAHPFEDSVCALRDRAVAQSALADGLEARCPRRSTSRRRSKRGRR